MINELITLRRLEAGLENLPLPEDNQLLSTGSISDKYWSTHTLTTIQG
jgi:hypothetical protein